jgi:hypothetical protein
VKTFLSYLGALWASPLTVVGALVVLVTWSRAVDRVGPTVVFSPRPGSWFDRFMERGRWAGYCIGDVVVLRSPWVTHAQVRAHEFRHVSQCHVFGPLTIPVWIVGVVVSACREWRAIYLSHPFERDARRAAGEQVDP